MDILDRFERRSIQDIQKGKKIDDNYESASHYKLILKIRKAMDMALRKDRPKSGYSIDNILKTGKLWD